VLVIEIDPTTAATSGKHRADLCRERLLGLCVLAALLVGAAELSFEMFIVDSGIVVQIRGTSTRDDLIPTRTPFNFGRH